VASAIAGADVVVLSPGSLFTSTIPALLGEGVREALADFVGPVVYAANVMTQPGETVGFTLSDHLRALADHVGPVVTDVLVHAGGAARGSGRPLRGGGSGACRGRSGGNREARKRGLPIRRY
jgi:uncharacterized cofD-like protein